MIVNVDIRIGAGDWQPPPREEPGVLLMRATAVAATGVVDGGWVRVEGLRLIGDAEMPERVSYLVRWDALPERAQALLPETPSAHVSQDRPGIEHTDLKGAHL